MAAPLELALLGSPALHQAGQPLGRFRSAKTYALLYYLAVTRRPQPRTVLAGLLWGDTDEYYARRNFNRTLSDLAQFVGEHLIIERQMVVFAQEQPYWLDVEVLESAATITPTPQTVTTLAAAADLYRGEFLEGFYVQDAPEFEQWVLNERTRLHTRALHLLDTITQFYADQGELPQALTYARRILHLEPWREETHRQLMLWLAQSGQRSAALAQYELCRQALQSELNVEPDAATLDLVARIRAGSFDQVTKHKVIANGTLRPLPEQPVAPPPAFPATPPPTQPEPNTKATERDPLVIPHNLLGQRTPFIGRETELADITRLLAEDDDCGLLTLIGAGGMGKTRLALKAAEQIVTSPALQQRFGDGVFFVPLENVSDANGLISAVISAISEESGFPLHSDAPLLEQLAHFLHTKALLLVLDNFEHLVKYADLCSTLLAAAPRLKILVTAREALTLQEAWFYPLLGLSFPQTPAEQEAPDTYDALRLFAQCARRTKPTFNLAAERAAVLRICTLVEGMPLGIELAAAWLKLMTCEQIAQEVARGLDFLTARYQNMPARHRSMRVVLEHSWILLAPEERTIAARLAVFRGAFSQAAAAEIAGASLFTLATLVEKALLRLRPDGNYQMHELTRQYAAEQLTETEATRNAHAHYYAGLTQQLGVQLYGPQSKATLAQLGLIADNVNSAWYWLLQIAEQRQHQPLAAGRLAQLIPTLAETYYVQARFQEGQQRFLQAADVLRNAGGVITTQTEPVQTTPIQNVFAQLQVRIAILGYDLGQYAVVLQELEAVLPILQAWGNAEELAQAFCLLGKANYRLGRRDEAVRQLEISLQHAQAAGYLLGQAAALNNLSHLAEDDGDYIACERLLRDCLAIYEAMNYPFGIGTTLSNLGHVYGLQGDYEKALRYSERALILAEQEGDPVSKLITLCQMADAKRVQRRYQAAIADYQRSLNLSQQLSYPHGDIVNLNGLAQTYLDLADLSSATRCLLQVLTIAQKSVSTTNALITLSLFAKLWRQQAKLEPALWAFAFVLHHPSATVWMKQAVQQLFDELAQTMTPSTVTQAQQWATTQTLPAVLTWAETLISHERSIDFR